MDGTSPKQIYEARLSALLLQQTSDQRRDRLYGYAKLLLAAAGLGLAAFLIRSTGGITVLVGFVLSFIVLFILQEKVIEAIRNRSRSLAFFERGLARLNNKWQSSGENGERFLDPSHPYARDLDLFGDSSLFQYLSNARTQTGEETLASWLLAPADADRTAGRQQAVKELSGRVDFRERVYAAGDAVRSATSPKTLIAWAVSGVHLSSTATRAATTVLALLWLASVVFWAMTGQHLPALLMTVLNFAYAHGLHSRLDRSAEQIEKAAAELRVLGDLLALIEQESFSAHRLRDLQKTLAATAARPSLAIKRLARLTELIQSRHSLFMRPLDLVTFWSAQLVFRAEAWKQRHGAQISEWLAVAGEVEALSSLAAFTFEHPEFAFPVFEATGPLFESIGLAHPLLDDRAVTNDVCLDSEHALVILSGPNMAGKSTFIRSIGVNAVLAQCGAPVRAARLRMSPLQVAASICVLDSLSGGVSRFYAEIRRLKLIDDLTQRDAPVLFLLDELLSGTNSHDRLAGTAFVLKTFLQRGAVGIVSTHDLALTRIPADLGTRARNEHFEDHLEGNQLTFDYVLKPGVVQTSNALKLMRSVGFGLDDSSDAPPVE